MFFLDVCVCVCVCVCVRTHLGHLCCVTDSLGSYLVTADHSQTRDKKRKEKERSEWGERTEWDKVRVHFLSVTSYLTSPHCYGCQIEWVSDESGSLHTPKVQQKSWLDSTATLHSLFTWSHRDANTQKHIFFYTPETWRRGYTYLC